MPKKDLPFTLGADPEFAVREKGQHIDACRVPALRSGYLGVDVNTTGEVRPGIANSPEEMIARIYTCFHNRKGEMSKDLTFHAGHFFDGLSLGGHLHCGGVDARCTESRALFFALDFLLMDCLSKLIDDMESYNKRATLSHYGRKSHEGKRYTNNNGSIEYKHYGGYEYRTPGSWLASPSIAFSNITLFSLANLIYLKHKSKCYDIFPDPNKLTDDQRLDILGNLDKMVDIPKSCHTGYKILQMRIESRKEIDWNINFRTEWKF